MEMQKLSVAALYGNTVWGCVIHKVANVGEIGCVYLFFFQENRRLHVLHWINALLLLY
jgi:hypothetical protein